MTCHSSSPHITSKPTTLLHLTPQATSWHQNRSHHHHGTAQGSLTAEKWFGHRVGWSPCAHSQGKLFLYYIVFFLLKLPPPARPGTTCTNVYNTWQLRVTCKNSRSVGSEFQRNHTNGLTSFNSVGHSQSKESMPCWSNQIQSRGGCLNNVLSSNRFIFQDRCQGSCNHIPPFKPDAWKFASKTEYSNFALRHPPETVDVFKLPGTVNTVSHCRSLKSIFNAAKTSAPVRASSTSGGEELEQFIPLRNWRQRQSIQLL